MTPHKLQLKVKQMIPANDQSGRSVRGPYSVPLLATPCLQANTSVTKPHKTAHRMGGLVANRS